jgi:hypothetical protein
VQSKQAWMAGAWALIALGAGCGTQTIPNTYVEDP